MKKIIYRVTKVGKKGNTTFSGIGYITEKDIIIAAVSQNGKPYVRVFENVIQYCHLVFNTTNEYRGAHTELVDAELTDANGAKTTRQVECDYLIWFKLAD